MRSVPSVMTVKMIPSAHSVTWGISLIALQRVLILVQGYSMGMIGTRVIRFVMRVMRRVRVARES